MSGKRSKSRPAKLIVVWVRLLCFLAMMPPLLVSAQDPPDLAALRIRKLTGKHIELFTDLPPSAAIDELPQVFDAAVPQLETYFRLPAGTLDKWVVKASLLHKDHADNFRRAGLFPTDLPPFLHGFARGRSLWVYEQESDYYRRHLLLHEGVHALMAEFLHGMGPPWYAEGMAELLATHRWKNGELALRVFPAAREDVPDWGRVKVLRDAVAAKEIPTLEQIFAYDNTAHRVVPPYAWSWAACVFFESHPQLGKAFGELQKATAEDDDAFNNAFRERIAKEGPLLAHEWQAFVSEADYGCIVDKTYLDRGATEAAPPQGKSVALRANRAWQSSGVKLEADMTYQVRVSGRYTLRQSPKRWESEPQGISIHYHRGQPLGMIFGAIVDESSPPERTSPLLHGAPLGAGREFTAKTSGVLYLRVNEPASGLGDNEGEFSVEIREK